MAELIVLLNLAFLLVGGILTLILAFLLIKLTQSATSLCKALTEMVEKKNSLEH